MEIRDARMRNILPYIKERTVLDIGCYSDIVNHDNEESWIEKGWIHGFLKKYASEVVGIDIIQDNVNALNEKGFQVYCQSADSFKLNKKFDVIFAGDVIEHLSNPGLFLDRAREHLKSDGWLIITTPNIFCLTYKIGGILRLRNNDLSVNKEHTAFFSPSVLQTLLERHGFEIKKLKFVNFHKVNTFKRYLQEMFCKLFGDKTRYNMMVFAQIKNP